VLATGVAGAEGRRPVFFEDPDPETARRIAAAVELMSRPYLDDHSRGRETLEEIGYWVVEPLLEGLDEGNTALQRNAALVLGTIRDPRGLKPLLVAARDERQRYLPAFAALMIGHSREGKTAARLGALVSNRAKTNRRISALLALAKIDSPESFEILRRFARPGERVVVRQTAIFCLGFFRDRVLEKGPDGEFVPIPEVARGLAASEARLRRAAVLALALAGHRDMKEFFRRAALNEREDDPDVKRIALLALGRFPDEDVTTILLNLLVSPREHDQVRLMAAFLLKDRNDPTALDRLKSARHLTSQDLKAGQTLALSNFDDEGALEIIARRLGDPSDRVRSAAAIGISRLTQPELKTKAVTILSALLEGKGGTIDPDVLHNMKRAREILRRGEAPGSFRWMGNKELAQDLGKDVEEKLLDLVNEEARRVLGITSLTPLRAARDPRFRVEDQNSELRDLKRHLDVHPYFVPKDVPAPRIAVTPRDADPVGRERPPK